MADFDANISVSVEWSYVACKWCGKEPSVLFQMDGGDCEDYIGRFLCRKHFLQLKRHIIDSLRLPPIPAEMKKRLAARGRDYRGVGGEE